MRKIMMISLLLVLFISSCSRTNEQKYLKDFDYFIKTIEENYPFLEMSERLSNLQWEKAKKAARDKVESCTSMNDFENIIDGVLEKLHNGHTQRIQDTQSLMYTMKLYEQRFAKQPRDYRYQMIKKLKTKAVYEHYGFDEKQFCDYVLPNAATDENVTVNAKALLLDGQVMYIRIPKMLSLETSKKDEEMLASFLKANQSAKALILDIRGNGGGNSLYWSEMLLPKIVDKTITVTSYVFLKDGEYANMIEGERITDMKLPNIRFPKSEFSQFSHGIVGDMKVVPAKDSIRFKKPIYLLIDENVYSSSEMLANFLKQSKAATIVGGVSGGDGIGSDPVLFALPNSGIVIRMAICLGVDEDGNINDEIKTQPDVHVKSTTVNEVSTKEDVCIQTTLQLIAAHGK